MSNIIEIRNEKHLEDVMNSHYNLIVLDIYADWCGPCQHLSPKLQELAEHYQYSSILFCKLNQELQLKQVSGLPTIEFWQKKNNSTERELVHSILGANLQEIKQTLSTYAQPTHIQQQQIQTQPIPPQPLPPYQAQPQYSQQYQAQPQSPFQSQAQPQPQAFNQASTQSCNYRNNKSGQYRKYSDVNKN